MGSKILKNPEILSEEFFPDKIINREQELKQINNSFGFVNSFIYGSVGSGKTLLLKKAILDHDSTQRIKALYINCSLYQTTNAVFHEVLRSLNRVVVTKSNYELTKRIRARLRHLNFTITICFDHFEYLKETDTLNKLLSLGINVIITAESMDSYRKLDAEAKSKITNIIEISPYTYQQTLEIINVRAEKALEKYTFSEKTIEKIVRLSEGNISLGLGLLKSLALKAESLDKNSLDDLKLNYEANSPNKKLSVDERILLSILKEWKSLPSSRLYDFYTEKTKHPKGKRSFRNYMESLCFKGLVRTVGEKRGRIYELLEDEGEDEG
jgi:Cdc6-like AAA superfamily ATPase